MSLTGGWVKRLPWLALPAVALALDLGSKAWILRTLAVDESKVVIPNFFSLSLGFNPGAIFGSFHNAPSGLRTALFLGAGLLALGYFGYEFLKAETSTIQRVALGLILGGALGNGIDRVIHGAVVDFLDFYARNWHLGFTTIHEWHYWAFNIADSCIVCGAALYGIWLWSQRKKES